METEARAKQMGSETDGNEARAVTTVEEGGNDDAQWATGTESKRATVKEVVVARPTQQQRRERQERKRARADKEKEEEIKSKRQDTEEEKEKEKEKEKEEDEKKEWWRWDEAVPVEIWVMILEKVGMEWAGLAARVCRGWREIVKAALYRKSGRPEETAGGRGEKKKGRSERRRMVLTEKRSKWWTWGEKKEISARAVGGADAEPHAHGRDEEGGVAAGAVRDERGAVGGAAGVGARGRGAVGLAAVRGGGGARGLEGAEAPAEERMPADRARVRCGSRERARGDARVYVRERVRV